MTSAVLDDRSSPLPGKSHWIPLTPFQIFAVVSLALVLMVIVGLNFFLSYFLAQASLRRDADLMTQFVNSMIDVEEARDLSVQMDEKTTTPEFWRALHELPLFQDVARANVYGRGGLVIWSTESEHIGQASPQNEELREAFHGNIVVDVGNRGARKSEHVVIDDRAPRLVENYLPIWSDDGDNSEVIGVVEIYRRLATPIDALVAYERVIWYAGAGGAVLLYGVIFFLFWHSSKTISRQQSQLVQADQLARMGEMASAVAHGIRNPLASIRSSAELALHKGASTATSARLESIIRESDRLEDWLRQYLIHADGQGGADSTPVQQVLRTCVDHINPMIEQKQVELVMDMGEGLSTCRLSPLVFFQLTYSLLANAVDAVPIGGCLAVRVGVCDGSVRISIEDSGPGMSKEQVEEAMKPFVTSKPTGLGLGLPLARQILSRHGGSLELDTQPGYGTRAIVSLPTISGAT